MKTSLIAAAALFSAALAAAETAKTEAEPKSATVATDLYPNDFGSAEIDVSKYPKEHKAAYRAFAMKCAACHTIARPINSQFLELSEAEQAEQKKADPDLFKDAKLVYVEDRIWNRYVKRMMAKPGCPVKGEDGKKIWEFLVYDSKLRKTGAAAKEWRALRKGLLDAFKKDYPDAYKKLFAEGEKSASAKTDSEGTK